MSLMLTLDLLATFAFALVGARVAADKGLDYGGVAFIAAVAMTPMPWRMEDVTQRDGDAGGHKAAAGCAAATRA